MIPTRPCSCLFFLVIIRDVLLLCSIYEREEFIRIWIFSSSYAGRDSAAATATGIKSSHYLEQKNYMQQAMAI